MNIKIIPVKGNRISNISPLAIAHEIVAPVKLAIYLILRKISNSVLIFICKNIFKCAKKGTAKTTNKGVRCDKNVLNLMIKKNE